MQEHAALHVGHSDGNHENEGPYHKSLPPGLHNQDVGVGGAVSSGRWHNFACCSTVKMAKSETVIAMEVRVVLKPFY
jgi:hypothetical protein